MSITELLEKVKEDAATRTDAENAELLRQANIIDSDGYYSADFFSSETVAKDRKSGKPVRN